MQKKALYIKTYGCQMNVDDTLRMQDVLRPLGYEPVDSPEGAEMVILNTCHIREKADEKVYSDLGRIRKEKKKREDANEPMLIAVAGCVAQAEGEEIFRRAPYVDMVFGPQSYHELPELVTRALRGQGKQVALDFPEVQKYDLLTEARAPQGAAAFLSVQEGCDKFCTFCVVPYTRGAEYSRTLETVLAEVRTMAAQGTIEITLLGQNVNAYHGVDAAGRTHSFAELLTAIAQVDGISRIRYMTSHPRDMDEALIALHGTEPKLMPYLHLPIQSGSDRILKKMNRKHTSAEYLAIIKRLREHRPDIAFSSDFIVGFPGETEEDFNATLALVQEVGYASAYSFKYSPRPGTPAASDTQQLEEHVKEERLARLQALLAQQSTAFNTACVGQNMDVLLERPGRKPGQLIGKSPYMQSVHVDAPSHLLGTLQRVRIMQGLPNSLSGEIIAMKVAA